MRDVVAVVQARMTSRRFPGKVLAPLAGRPLVEHVLERSARAVGREAVVLATSEHASDAPLARFVSDLGFVVHRGPLDDTVARFRGALAAHPAERFFRVCADSPLLDPDLMTRMRALAPGTDLVTNVHPRSFPPGRSMELVRTGAFLAFPSDGLLPDEREHLTLHFYRNAGRYRIANVEATPAEAALPPLAVDTVEDLHRVEDLVAKGAIA